MILELLTAVTFFLGGVAAFSAAYPLLLTALAWVTRIRQKPITFKGPPTTRFAILVPAHDEEVLIGRLLTSLRDIDSIFMKNHRIVIGECYRSTIKTYCSIY